MSKIEITEFAKHYFASEARAKAGRARGLCFRSIDKKELARECSQMLSSGSIDSITHLAHELESLSGVSNRTHLTRLREFARTAGITYPSGRTTKCFPPVARAATSKVSDIRRELGNSFTKALRSGVTLINLQKQVNEVLLDCNKQQQESKVTDHLKNLMNSTGLTSSQLAEIANRL